MFDGHQTTHNNAYYAPPPSDWDRMYPYTADLMCLNWCTPTQPTINTTPRLVDTPLDVTAWTQALAHHPDQAFASYVLNGLREGFKIGFRHGCPLRSASSNMQSALTHPQVITDYIQAELAKGRLVGPLSPTSAPLGTHINRFGVIPKGHNTGKWRLITDLSYPPGHSVNDGIDPTLCSLTYTSVDEVAEIVTRLGRGALLAKIDIEAAYRLVPVHPQDRPLQAVQWEKHIYLDKMLPFGLRSAPKIFNALADALHWYLTQRGIPDVRYYLDDFIIVAPPNSQLCRRYIGILDEVCNTLKVPIAAHKRDGPTTCLTFLGIEVDTAAGHLRLPTEKLERLIALLAEWESKRSCVRKDLESLIGHLNHACKVVRPGRSFLRRMIDLLHAIHHPPHSQILIRLNANFRADLAWWATFVTHWNGVAFLNPPSSWPQHHITTDASGSWGCGAWHIKSWFQVQWDATTQNLSIAEKELIPIILACSVWAPRWRNTQVICHCDNQVVVACLRSRSSRVKVLMHMIRCLVYLEAQFEFHLSPLYISTHDNHLADDLSRNNLFSFLSKVPKADTHPSPIPRELIPLLTNPEQNDWTTPSWRQQFRSTFS